MTERLFARQGRAPRRLQVCVREAKLISHVTKKLAKSGREIRGLPSILPSLTDAWDAAQTGKCKLARKRIVKVLKKTSLLWGTTPARLRRQGLIY
jgi:hypothetical protein